MTHLFTLGKFAMHSGDVGRWKIECDALTDSDLECLALMIAERVLPFGEVIGVPRGGLRLADALSVHATNVSGVLIADDVLTTGASMSEVRAQVSESYAKASGGVLDTRGAVIFARGPAPEWITPLFRMSDRGNDR